MAAYCHFEYFSFDFQLKWCSTGVVICLERDADLYMAQLMPLPLTVSCFSKSRLVLPFWYWLTWVVPEKGPLNRCVCVFQVKSFIGNELLAHLYSSGDQVYSSVTCLVVFTYRLL